MPLYIASEYEIQLVKLYGHDFLLVGVKSDFTTGRLKKYLDTIGAKLDTKGIAVIAQLEAHKRIRLIEKRIPFIIPGKQMYLPDLLIDLKEIGNKPKGLPATMRPATQFFLMYHLQVGPLDGIISSYRVPIGKIRLALVPSVSSESNSQVSKNKSPLPPSFKLPTRKSSY